MSTEPIDGQDGTEVPTGDADAGDETTTAAELAVLREENSRLREQFRRAQQTTYRRTAGGFVGLGIVALVAGVAFPDVRTLLVALGGTGVFAGLLTWFVTPETFHPARVSEHVHAAAAANANGLIEELGLQDERMYVPRDDGAVRLYVPAHRQFVVPSDRALASTVVITDDDAERGVALEPSGVGLYGDFEAAATPAAEHEDLAAQLGDAVVEQFELARGVSVTVEPDAGEARFEITGSSCGSVDAFDHPAVSFLAVGLAEALDEPVRVEYSAEDGLVRCVWDEHD